MSMSKREKILILIVLILAAAGVFYIYLLKPNLDTVNELSLQRINKESMLSNQDIQQKEAAELSNQIDILEKEIAGYNQNIVQGFDQPEILVYLENTINAHGKKMMFSFGSIEHIGKMDVCPVTVTMTGTYDGLKSILRELSSGKHIIKVTSLNAAQMGSMPPSQPLDTSSISDLGLNIDELLDNEDSVAATPPPNTDGTKELQVTLTLEVYTMSGDIPADKAYSFDKQDNEYGGDIFY